MPIALLIEDDTNARELMERHLTESGTVRSCVGTSALEEALRILREQRKAFDVVLLDLKLTDSDAASTVRRFDEIETAAQGSPVVVVTGYPNTESIDGLRRRSVDVLQKPYIGEELNGSVRRAMARVSIKAQPQPQIRKQKHMEDTDTKDRSEVLELHREWRRDVMETMKEFRNQSINLTNLINEARAEFATRSELKVQADRITALEHDKSKLKGAVLVLQVVAGVLTSVAAWLASKFWK